MALSAITIQATRAAPRSSARRHPGPQPSRPQACAAPQDPWSLRTRAVGRRAQVLDGGA